MSTTHNNGLAVAAQRELIAHHRNYNLSVSRNDCPMGHVHMMSALGGGPPKADDSTDKMRECDSDKGEGDKKSADVICTCPLCLGSFEVRRRGNV